MTRDHVEGVTHALLDAGMALGPQWSEQPEAGAEVVCYTVAGDDERLWERIRKVVESLGLAVDYYGAVYPSAAFGTVVIALGLDERTAMLLSELIRCPNSIAATDEYELLAAYQREVCSRKLYHGDITLAARRMAEKADLYVLRQVGAGSFWDAGGRKVNHGTAPGQGDSAGMEVAGER